METARAYGSIPYCPALSLSNFFMRIVDSPIALIRSRPETSGTCYRGGRGGGKSRIMDKNSARNPYSTAPYLAPHKISPRKKFAIVGHRRNWVLCAAQPGTGHLCSALWTGLRIPLAITVCRWFLLLPPGPVFFFFVPIMDQSRGRSRGQGRCSD